MFVRKDSHLIRVGMIGLDTSHVPAFTRIINSPSFGNGIEQLRIIAGYPGGTDLPLSRGRVAAFTQNVREMGVEIMPTISDLISSVDAVMIQSVDGRAHLREAIPVILSGKPLFIDKPVAGSLSEAVAIYDLAAKEGVPVFSSSASRYSSEIRQILDDATIGGIVGGFTWGPCKSQPGIPDMFFYGIHGIEVLYTLMGTGCEMVSRISTSGTDLVTGVWSGGRIGSYRGIRNDEADFGAIAFGTRGMKSTREKIEGYEGLCHKIAEFFIDKKPPISPETTLEIVAFMEAADESKRFEGQPFALQACLEKARDLASGQLAKAFSELGL